MVSQPDRKCDLRRGARTPGYNRGSEPSWREQLPIRALTGGRFKPEHGRAVKLITFRDGFGPRFMRQNCVRLVNDGRTCRTQGCQKRLPLRLPPCGEGEAECERFVSKLFSLHGLYYQIGSREVSRLGQEEPCRGSRLTSGIPFPCRFDLGFRSEERRFAT